VKVTPSGRNAPSEKCRLRPGCLVSLSADGAPASARSRPVKWLALRVPALYRDTDWDKPKRELDREDIARYRRGGVMASENRALEACSRFFGDVLIVESEHDDVVPHETLLSYRSAFSRVRSLSYRMITSADHALSDPTCREAYSTILTTWTTEMILRARIGS
jgi:hypothetical protein